MKNTSEFNKRYQRWKAGELVYSAGKIVPEYEDGKDKVVTLPEVEIRPSSEDFNLMMRGQSLIPDKNLRRDIVTAYLSSDANAANANQQYSNMLDLYLESGSPKIQHTYSKTNYYNPLNNTMYLHHPGLFYGELAHAYQQTHPQYAGVRPVSSVNDPNYKSTYETVGTQEYVAHKLIEPMMVKYSSIAKHDGSAVNVLNSMMNVYGSSTNKQFAGQSTYVTPEYLLERLRAGNYKEYDPTTSLYKRGKDGDSEYYDYLSKLAEKKSRDWVQPPLKPDADLTMLNMMNDPTYDYRALYDHDRMNAMYSLYGGDHFTDVGKTWYHPTFSDESIYSGKISDRNPFGAKGGHWNGEYEYVLSPDQMMYGWNVPATLDYLKGTGVKLKEPK